MPLITIEGVYENGKVTLTESPQGVQRAKVVVTFLPQVETGSSTPKRRSGRTRTQTEATVLLEKNYPQSLRDEYKVLIQKKLHRTLTDEEAVRLEAVREEINQLDRQCASWADWEHRAAEVDRELSELKRELEALPDAR